MRHFRLFKTIQVKIIVIYVLLILIAMQLIGVYFVNTIENSFVGSFTQSLNNRVELLTQYVRQYIEGTPVRGDTDDHVTYEDLNDVVNNFNKISGAEIQVINSSGVVISSSSDPDIVGQKQTQPDITQALQGFSNEEKVLDGGMRKLAIALPVKNNNKVIGVVYVISSMEEIYGTINNINRIFIAGTLIALALTAFLGILLSNTITSPIKEITRTAKLMAEGNFHEQVKVSGNDEIGQLAYAFNFMVNRLKEALSSNEEEKEKLASILANMSDGVIATDDMGRIIVVNKRARQILRLMEEPLGQEIAIILGMEKEQLQTFMQSDHHTSMIELAPTEDEDHVVIRVAFTPIHRRERTVAGTIIVLQDVTEQQKMEHQRKEFVANVSHELRTPLTTIKSYLEALQDGAIDDKMLARKFVGVAGNETERMIRLVTDLLHLSRFDSNQTIVAKQLSDISSMLEDVADRFSFQSRQKRIAITLAIEPGLNEVYADPDQIDQVLDNLVSNAIKYTSDGGDVILEARNKDADWVEVAVSDTGIGIPKKDLVRIFERFYRVDKARSRSMGGTGLGLSIAREIVRAHGGHMALESDLNQGTRVSFTLPRMGKGSEAG